MIVSATEADNLTMLLMVVCDFTEMCASLNFRSVIAHKMQLQATTVDPRESVMLGLGTRLRPMTTGLVGLGLGLEGCGLEGHGIGVSLGTHVRLVAGDGHVFEVQ